jgi:probable HAF family extracellular repeat protein
LSQALAVSADGKVVVGDSRSVASVSLGEAFRWTQTSGMVGLGDLPGGQFASQAFDVSANGSVVVGRSESGQFNFEAFRWTQATGMLGLGFIQGSLAPINASSAEAVSPDGSVVVDGSLVVGRDIIGGPTDFEAFIWDGTNGMRNLRELLIAQGNDLTGWSLSEARGISADGRIIIGFGINPEGNREAWLAELTPQQVVPEPVAIDVKPGSSENPINPRSNGVISIAILSTNSFDPSTVDQASVEFGPNQALATGRGQLQDVNGDGLPDLVLHFRTQDSGIQCGDTSVSITGQTVDGTPIQGSDSITTVGCKPVAADQKKK